MTAQVKSNDTKQTTPSEKALRLLAAHDREIKNFEGLMAPIRKVSRWG